MEYVGKERRFHPANSEQTGRNQMADNFDGYLIN